MTSTSATDPKFLVRYTGCGEMHDLIGSALLLALLFYFLCETGA